MAGQIRQPIDLVTLERYLSEAVPEITSPLDVKQFGFGQSNPTYQLTGSDGRRFVLRKKPPGKLLSQAAHKVEREYRVMKALGPTAVPVPRTYALCEDPGVIGTPFYVMEFLDGRIFEDFTMPGVSAEERTAMWRAAVQTLGALHKVKPDNVGLGSFGKCEGFYGRQVRTWEAICVRQAAVKDVETGEEVGELPHMSEMVTVFGDVARQPGERSVVVHGDYKIDNLVFHKTEPKVIGILDWEMSTIGHPLSDLCNFLTKFSTPSTEPAFAPGQTPGLPDARRIIGWYAEAAGYDPRAEGELDFGSAFNLFRLAAICQGIAARYAARQASSERAREHSLQRAPLAEMAWELIQRDERRRERERKGAKL